MAHEFLNFGERITVIPVIHGSGDYAIAVRRALLADEYDCLALPLPPSFRADVEAAVQHLPTITAVVQEEHRDWDNEEWSPEKDRAEEEHESALGDENVPSKRICSYVPIDPCQPVIAALRTAMGERIPRAFIDCEVASFEEQTLSLPDPYALKHVDLAKFSAAILPTIPRPKTEQMLQRIQHMAGELRKLEKRYKRILCLCSVLEWPWLREAWQEYSDKPVPADAEKDEVEVEETSIYRIDPTSLLFLLGELPFITGLYETARNELDDDENLSVDGVKEMLLASRTRYQDDLKVRARKITPHLLSNCLKYVRNLSLIERRLTPDLYTLIVASQQTGGDQFAIHVAETARSYPFAEFIPFDELQMGIGKARFPDGGLAAMKSRLPGQPVTWRTCQLNRRPPKIDQQRWQMQWNPFRQCSWPPEDVSIERFRTHVKDKALSLLGNDLARSEKFTTSLKDGLDIRETLRNWHTGNLFVKILPPSRGSLDCVVMLFDSPADPRDYPWRITWHAEHHDESTLSFYATDQRAEIVGPGIALASYGGAMFLFPPRDIPDVWRDQRFDFTDTLEERLLVSACVHSRENHIAILSESPPGAGWRRLAKRFGKKLLHVPLAHFSQETIQKLRMFHVLNGHQIRSFAEHFIRKP